MRFLLKFLISMLISIGFFVAIVGLGLYYINRNPISISNEVIQNVVQRYDSSLTTLSKNSFISYYDKHLVITSDQIKIKKSNDYAVNLQNINFSLNLLHMESKLSLKIIQSHILHVISNPVIAQYRLKHRIIFNGDLDASFILTSLTNIDLNLTSNQGWYDCGESKYPRHDIEKFDLALNYSPEKLIVNRLNLNYKKSFQASFNGEFNFEDQELVLAKFQSNIKNLEFNNLRDFWPNELYPEIKSWVTGKISNGLITEANGNFNLTKNDLITNKINPKALETQIEFKNLELNYLDGFTPIKKINGFVKFDGTQLALTASSAQIAEVNLQNIELTLPFTDYILNLKTNISGPLIRFEEFIPLSAQKKLNKYGVNLKTVKGTIDGNLYLSIPIFADFKINNVKIDVKAEVKDLIFDKHGLIMLRNGKLELLNQEDKIVLKIRGYQVFSFELSEYHQPSKENQNQIKLLAEISNLKNLNFSYFKFLEGPAILDFSVNNVGWTAKIDLTNQEIDLTALGYTKNRLDSLLLNCDGKNHENFVKSESCNITGNQYAGKFFFDFSTDTNELVQLSLDQVKIGDNLFSAKIENNSYQINAKFLNFSNIKFDSFFNKDSKFSNNYNIAFDANEILMKNSVIYKDFSAKIKKENNKPIAIALKTNINNNILTLNKIIDKNSSYYSLHTAAAGTFLESLNIYNKISGGEMLLEIYPDDYRNQIYSAKIKINNFSFSDTSALTRIIMGIISPFNSPAALAQTLQGGKLKADKFSADFKFSDAILQVSNGLVQANSYDIKIAGNINLYEKKIDLKGMYIPSAYGINKLVTFIPFLGNLISGGKNSALIGANFSIKGNFDNSKIDFSKLSLITFGFLRNLFN